MTQPAKPGGATGAVGHRGQDFRYMVQSKGERCTRIDVSGTVAGAVPV